MNQYHNYGGDSGVIGYEIGDDYIIVQFSTEVRYLYNYSTTGVDKVETMKTLAQTGEGLNEYINRYARKDYAAKL